MNTRDKLLVLLRERNGVMAIDIYDQPTLDELGTTQSILAVIVEDLSKRGFITAKYSVVHGENTAKYFISITDRGREMVQEIIRDGESIDEPPHILLRGLADEVEKGETAKPVVIVFDDGSVRRINVSKDRAVARLMKAVTGIVK